MDIQEKVKLLIADPYFEQGGELNLAEALARYKSFLTFFPSSEHADDAQHQPGRSYFKQLGDPDRDQSFTDQGIFEYQKLIDNYPESEYVSRERTRKREEAAAKEEAKRAEKKAKEEAALASETAEQKAKREKKEAKQRAEAERLEAEEQRKAEKNKKK